MVEPKCPNFGECGGCSYQHIAYPLQLKKKKAFLQNILKQKDILVLSGEQYLYRNRMDFVFFKGGLGFRRKGSWTEFSDVERCYISNEKLNQLLSEVRSAFIDIDPFDPIKKEGSMVYAVIRAPMKSSSISFVINKDSPRKHIARKSIEDFSRITSADNILITYISKETHVSVSLEYEIIKGNKNLIEWIMGFEFRFSAQGFFQNNSQMAQMMHDHVHSILKKKDTRDAALIDLFGGVGTFGIVNSRLFSSVTIIENNSECAQSCKENISGNSIGNAKIIEADAKTLGRYEADRRLFMVVDPPRAGIGKATLEAINRLRPLSLIYVSCNPKSLAQDLKKLKRYSMMSAALIDLFPQTPHMEAVIELEAS